MAQFEHISPKDIRENPFELIGNDWALLTAEKEDHQVNTMTISWGMLGIMWGVPSVLTTVRPERYTKEFMDDAQKFSLSFFERRSHRKELGYLGEVSGRDEKDKIQRSGLTVAHHQGIPYFEEAKLVIFAKNSLVKQVDPSFFVNKGIEPKWYENKNFHYLYIAEISDVLEKKN